MASTTASGWPDARLSRSRSPRSGGKPRLTRCTPKAVCRRPALPDNLDVTPEHTAATRQFAHALDEPRHRPVRRRTCRSPAVLLLGRLLESCGPSGRRAAPAILRVEDWRMKEPRDVRHPPRDRNFWRCPFLAEGVGFEPTIRFPVYTLSKRAPSATRPPLRSTEASAI